jgi:16S rRNA (adenine1518-N6/adenine1519-N6)-dimethyltransferase
LILKVGKKFVESKPFLLIFNHIMFAKKSLGQNFLKSKGAVREIVAAARVQSDDTVLEIGPGKGVLTESLLETGAHVIAVEKDDRLIELLNEKFANFVTAGKFTLIHADILTFSPKDYGLTPHTYKLVANIPYYITGEVMRQFLENEAQPSLMVLMVQKEVATRITTRDGKESILSLSAKAYGNPKYINTVKARFFSPVPKVDSAILLIDSISKGFFNDFNEETFFKVIKTAFAHKRKVVINNLEPLTPKEVLVRIFNEKNISLTARAEEIPIALWKEIIVSLYPHKNQVFP